MSQRTILLLRHGEAEYTSPTGEDHGRRLTNRGRQQIDSVSQQLLAIEFQAGLVYCSNSRRTLETFERVPPEITHEAVVNHASGLYLAEEEVLFDYLLQIDDAISSVLLVGHNPGLSDIGSFLSRQSYHLATGGGLLLQGDFDSWSSDCKPSNFRIIKHIQA